MKRIIVYGLGKEYETQAFLLEREYDIVAVTDKNANKADLYSNFVMPELIVELDWDYIYVSSSRFFDEIKNELVSKYQIGADKIIGLQNVWWNVSNSKGREEWIAEQLKNIPAGKKILDAGAGNQKYRVFCEHLDYVSQDFGEYDDIEKKEGLIGGQPWKSKECDIVCDITSIPVPNYSFDYILCSEVIEHVKYPIKVISEFSRIICSGGYLLLTAPFCSLTHMAPFYYYNGFSKFWYRNILSEAGFEIVEEIPHGNYFSWMAQELIRTNYMCKKYGKKLDKDDLDSMYKSVKIFMQQSKVQKNSEDVLCFGYYIKARKGNK